MMSTQPALFADPALPAPLAAVGRPADTKSRGAVYTKPAVVDFMLDLVGYVPTAPLWERRLLEPSCGAGGFLLAAIERLVTSWREGAHADDDTVLDDAIRAVELDEATYQDARRATLARLEDLGIPELSAARIVRKWLVRGDFLLCSLDGLFDYVVGNPPYVRQELIPDALLRRYRSSYRTMVGRADLYVAFFEHGLDLLSPHGKLSFICADAWTKNDYGRVLREIVTSRHGLAVYVDMYGLDVFEDSVGAYPSITVIGGAKGAGTRTAAPVSADAAHLARLATELTLPQGSPVPTVALKPGAAPWLLRTPDQQDVIRDLEARFDALE